MKPQSAKERLKDLLGRIPFTAELYWMLRQPDKPIRSRFTLKEFQARVPEMVLQTAGFAEQAKLGKKVLIFATLHYWIEQAALLGLSLAGQGHDVTLAYLPYADWQKPISKFDLRRQDIYARYVLEKCQPYLKVISLLNYPDGQRLPKKLQDDVKLVSNYDAQYTLQVEEVAEDNDIYQMRLLRNKYAAEKLHKLMAELSPDVVTVPNGTIQELGVAYRVARYLKIPVTTYEFSDQKDRIWLACNEEIMRQETDAMWHVKKELPFTDEQKEKIQALFRARVQGKTWENFVRNWQSVEPSGKNQAAKNMGLDDRPVVLLATNVLGDSLTLGRQVFSKNMAEWITRSVQYFTARKDVQLIIRVHPGEVLTHGPSMVDVVRKAVPEIQENIHLVLPTDKTNTYDLVEMADLGLVYTTTTGLEMAMSGVPVIVAGFTHYRSRGFTNDPNTYDEYFKMLDNLLEDPSKGRLSADQIEQAWHYAYCFFFEYAIPFPWRVVDMWKDLKERPIPYVLGEGMGKYSNTFRYITGDPIQW